MTAQEHQLMIGILAKQLQLIKVLVELLKSREILHEGDFGAFLALTTQYSSTADDLIDQAEKLYRGIATPLGVEVPAKLL